MTQAKKRGTKRAHAGLFVKGFDPRRNMAGRPKVGETIAEKIRAAMAEKIRPDGYSKLDALIDEAMARAKYGNYQLLEILWSRAYGKVPDKIEFNPEPKPDLSKLSDQEIAELGRLLEKAKPA